MTSHRRPRTSPLLLGEKACAVAMRRRGVKLAAIAAHLGRNEATLRRVFAKDLREHIDEHRARAAKIEASSAARPPKPPRPSGVRGKTTPAPAEEIARIVELRAAGWTFRKIAAELRRHESTVRRLVKLDDEARASRAAPKPRSDRGRGAKGGSAVRGTAAATRSQTAALLEALRRAHPELETV